MFYIYEIYKEHIQLNSKKQKQNDTTNKQNNVIKNGQ